MPAASLRFRIRTVLRDRRRTRQARIESRIEMREGMHDREPPISMNDANRLELAGVTSVGEVRLGVAQPLRPRGDISEDEKRNSDQRKKDGTLHGSVLCRLRAMVTSLFRESGRFSVNIWARVTGYGFHGGIKTNLIPTLCFSTTSDTIDR